MTTYYNPKTHQTAKVNSDKADKDGNVWVQIDGGFPKQVNWDNFLKEFNSIVCDVKMQQVKNDQRESI